MSETEEQIKHHDAFPQLNDAEYLTMLRKEEAVAALIPFIRQRVLGLISPNEERKYDYKENFFLADTIMAAYEIAEVVLDSAGSFNDDRPVANLVQESDAIPKQ
jgi:hypothetical protein